MESTARARSLETAIARSDEAIAPWCPLRAMLPSEPRPVNIIGGGRSQRRDDQLGLEEADRLARRTPTGCQVCRSEDPGTDLLLDLDGVRLLALIDAAACSPRLAEGRICRLRYQPAAPGSELSAFERLPLGATHSTHLLSVGEGLRIAEQLGLLPQEVWIYVVGAVDFGYGPELSPCVGRALPRLERRIRADVRTWLARLESARA